MKKPTKAEQAEMRKMWEDNIIKPLVEKVQLKQPTKSGKIHNKDIFIKINKTVNATFKEAFGLDSEDILGIGIYHLFIEWFNKPSVRKPSVKDYVLRINSGQFDIDDNPIALLEMLNYLFFDSKLKIDFRILYSNALRKYIATVQGAYRRRNDFFEKRVVYVKKLTISIKNFYKYDNPKRLSILLHELIHVLDLQEQRINMNHGKLFDDKRIEINNRIKEIGADIFLIPKGSIFITNGVNGLSHTLSNDVIISDSQYDPELEQELFGLDGDNSLRRDKKEKMSNQEVKKKAMLIAKKCGWSIVKDSEMEGRVHYSHKPHSEPSIYFEIEKKFDGEKERMQVRVADHPPNDSYVGLIIINNYNKTQESLDKFHFKLENWFTLIREEEEKHLQTFFKSLRESEIPVVIEDKQIYIKNISGEMLPVEINVKSPLMNSVIEVRSPEGKLIYKSTILKHRYKNINGRKIKKAGGEWLKEALIKHNIIIEPNNISDFNIAEKHTTDKDVINTFKEVMANPSKAKTLKGIEPTKPPVDKPIPQPQENGFKTYSAEEIMNATAPDGLKLNKMKGFFGENLLPDFNMLIWGRQGSWKSTFALAFGEDLSYLDKTAYVTSEENPVAGRFQKRMQRLGSENFENLTILKIQSYSDLVRFIETTDAKFIIIDSITRIDGQPTSNKTDADPFLTLLQAYPEKNFILLAHGYKQGKTYKGEGIGYDVDVEVAMENGVATLLKNRDGAIDEEGWDFKAFVDKTEDENLSSNQQARKRLQQRYISKNFGGE